MSEPKTSRAPGVWAVTSFFNPAHYATRIENYYLFRRRLTVPLVTVELSDGPDFQLQAGDADMLIRRQSRDVMWQKERLLNIAIQSVPKDCDMIVWLDCDVVFQDNDWPERTRRELQRCRIVQPFRVLYDVPTARNPESLTQTEFIHKRSSYASALKAGVEPESLVAPGACTRAHVSTGHAWAMRRDLIARHGLYDARIIGGGDKCILCAARGELDVVAMAHEMNSEQRAHFEDWANPFLATVRARVGDVDGVLYHLSHGDLEARGTRRRHAELSSHGFDP
jgi:hypothetical protein